MILHEQPTKEWRPFDFLLLEAYQILQDETCPQCGQPVWICRSTDRNVYITVQKARCFVTAELEKAQDGAKGKKTLKPGEYMYPQVRPLDAGTELPTREDYFNSLIE